VSLGKSYFIGNTLKPWALRRAGFGKMKAFKDGNLQTFGDHDEQETGFGTSKRLGR
jgi:hypothetical protein